MLTVKRSGIASARRVNTCSASLLRQNSQWQRMMSWMRSAKNLIIRSRRQLIARSNFSWSTGLFTVSKVWMLISPAPRIISTADHNSWFAMDAERLKRFIFATFPIALINKRKPKALRLITGMRNCTGVAESVISVPILGDRILPLFLYSVFQANYGFVPSDLWRTQPYHLTGQIGRPSLVCSFSRNCC